MQNSHRNKLAEFTHNHFFCQTRASLIYHLQSFAYDGKTVIVAATLSDIKKAEQGKGDMDSKKLVRVPSKVSNTIAYSGIESNQTLE